MTPPAEQATQLNQGPGRDEEGVATNDPQVSQYLERCVTVLERLLEPTRTDFQQLEFAAAKCWTTQQVAAMHRHLARQLIAQHADRIGTADLPDDIRDCFKAERVRIETEISSQPSAHFTFSNYRFKADMRILCGRRIPAGMYDLEVSAIPKRLIFSQDLAGALRLIQVVAIAGGFVPYFTQHVAPSRIGLFSSGQRELFLRRAASLLRRHGHIRGLISTAWYNDPAVAQISPHLAYLRDGWERWGHGVFKIGTSDDVAQGAIARSMKRRRLVESGHYVPTAYLGIARRSQLLAFA